MFSFMKNKGQGAAKTEPATAAPDEDGGAAIKITPARKGAEKAPKKAAKPKLTPDERKALAAQNAAKMAEKQAEILRAIPGLHWLAALLLIAAIGAVGVTAAKVKAVAGLAKTNEGVEAHATIKLDKTALTEAEYASIVEWYSRMHPTISFAIDKRDQALLVSSAKPEHHADWIYALAALQARDTSVLWESDLFCVGRCENGATVAKVKGYRQKVSVE